MRIKALLFGFGVATSVSFIATLVQQLSSQPMIREAVASTVPAERAVHADGSVATRGGKRITLSAELQSRVVAVHVSEGQSVKRGDVLAELDDKELRAVLREASATASEAWARAKARRADVRRSQSLVESGALPKYENDRVREERSAAEGRLAASSASAARVRALLEKTRIVAPIDGTVVTRKIEPSEVVAPGTPLFVVADLGERRVEAEVDEYDIGRVVLGAPATITADGFPNLSWKGVVEAVPDTVSPRRLRPQDPARPTDSAVLSVKVAITESSPLKLGQRVTVTFPLSK